MPERPSVPAAHLEEQQGGRRHTPSTFAIYADAAGRAYDATRFQDTNIRK